MHRDEDRSRTALVVGAGISGLSTAIALAKAGWRPVVVERASQRRRSGYFVVMYGSGRIAAERLGMTGLRNRMPVDSRTSQIDRAGNRRPGLGFQDVPGVPWMLLRGDVERAAFDALPEGLDIRFSTVPTAIEQDAGGVDVTLHDTSSDRTTVERFGLVVGADGLRSTVRRLVFGPPERFLQPLGYMIAAFALPGALPGLEASEGVILGEPGRSFWVFPFADHPPTVLFSYRTDDVDAEFGRPVAERIREVYGPEPLGDLMESAVRTLESTDEVLFDSVAQVRVDGWHEGRVVLIGDAAWCVTLYVGMGAAAGIAGADALGRRLEAHPDDLEAALTSWEAKLRPAIADFQASARSMRPLFTQESAAEMRRLNATLGFRRMVLRSRLFSGVLARTRRFRLRNSDLAG